jgi:hypothetical protein
MQAVAAEFSGCAENCGAFWEKNNFETLCLSFISKEALKQARSVCIRAI